MNAAQSARRPDRLDGSPPDDAELPATARLRVATAAAHARLDTWPVAHRLLESGDDRQAYRAYLEGLRPGLSALERALRAAPHLPGTLGWTPRAFLIDADLADLDDRPETHDPHLPEKRPARPAADGDDLPPAPRLRTRGAALGVLYVLEGSRMGASMTLRRLERDPDGRPAWPTRWLEAQAKDAGTTWARVRATLDAELRSADALAEAIEAAGAAFATIALGIGGSLDRDPSPTTRGSARP